MHMLADLVELVIGVDTHKDTHTAAVVDRGHRRGARPGDRAGHPGRLPAAAPTRRPTRRSARVGDRGHRRLRRRADPVPACPSRASCRVGPAQAGRPPPWCQVRPPGCDQGGPRGPGPRPPRPAKSGRPPCGLVGAAGRPTFGGPGRHRRPTPAPRPRGRRPRPPPRTVAQPHHTSPCQRLRAASAAGHLGHRDRRHRSQPARPGPPHPTPEHRGRRPHPSHQRLGADLAAGPAHPHVEWARSWPPSCCAPGPIRAAAQAMPPSPCWAARHRSPPPAARPSGSG